MSALFFAPDIAGSGFFSILHFHLFFLSDEAGAKIDSAKVSGFIIHRNLQHRQFLRRSPRTEPPRLFIDLFFQSRVATILGMPTTTEIKFFATIQTSGRISRADRSLKLSPNVWQ